MPSFPTKPSVVLFGQTACNNAARLECLLQTEWHVKTIPDEHDTAALRAALPEADALVSLGWGLKLNGTPTHLRLIQALGAGTDTYDMAAMPVGCALCNVYEHATPIAEFVIGSMVALTVRLIAHDRQLRQGNWHGSGRRDGEPHGELAGKTVGMIGFGTIGREIARRAAAMYMQVRVVRARPDAPLDGATLAWVGGPDQLQELLIASDYLVVCCPLTRQTHGLLNTRTLGWLKPGAYVINVARAEIIEERALYDALNERRLAGAALDVWYRYPSDADERLLPAELPFHELDNVLMTPHLSAWTHAMIQRRWAKIAANLDALASGRLLENIVALR